jgi:hypothetical protein
MRRSERFSPTIEQHFRTNGSNALVSDYFAQIPQASRLRSVDNGDLAEIQVLQNRWDQALGNKSESGKFENYNPVLARWNFERATTGREKELFRINEIKNIDTALKERNNTEISRLSMTIEENGKIRNDMMPDELYEDVLKRGLWYRATHGSNETKRERNEVEGFLKIQKELGDKNAKVGTKFIVISPPGLVEDTPYVHNFVDIYELVEEKNTKKRSIEYTRFASPLDYKNYRKIAENLEPDYFDGQAGPKDAWYLGHPIKINFDAGVKNADDVFEKYFQKDATAMKDEIYEDLWKNYYFPVALYLIDQIAKDDFDPVAIAEAYNTLLQGAENKKLKKENIVYINPNSIHLNHLDQKQIAAMVGEYGRQKVEEVKAGCGRSGGYTIGGSGNAESSDPWAKKSFAPRNSVALFASKNTGEEQEWFNCPKCSYIASGPIGNKCPGCKLTKEEFAESGGEIC